MEECPDLDIKPEIPAQHLSLNEKPHLQDSVLKQKWPVSNAGDIEHVNSIENDEKPNPVASTLESTSTGLDLQDFKQEPGEPDLNQYAVDNYRESHEEEKEEEEEEKPCIAALKEAVEAYKNSIPDENILDSLEKISQEKEVSESTPLYSEALLHEWAPSKPKRKTNAELCKEYRERVRSDPVAYEYFRVKKKEDYHRWLSKLTPERRAEMREKARLRQKKRREKMKQQNLQCLTVVPAVIVTKKRKKSKVKSATDDDGDERRRRERNKLSQRKCRQNMSVEKKLERREQRRQYYYRWKSEQNAT